MQAAVVHAYGGPEVVRIAEVATPVPGAGEVLVRVAAAAVTSADARIRGAHFPPGFGFFARLAFGLRRPRRPILGNTFSGVVEGIGSRVDGFTAGDEVCGMTGAKFGAHAQYLVVPVRKVARKPSAVSHDDAAGLLFGGATALFFLRDKVAISTGATLLVNGASGAIGTNAIQLGKYFGATVTAVTSAANAVTVTSLGADQVIDYAVQGLDDITDRFDVVLDTVGNVSIASGRRLLRDGGKLALAVAGLFDIIRARGNVVAGSAPERAADFELLLQLVADGMITVVHDETLTLDDISTAYRRVDSGRKIGNIVVRP